MPLCKECRESATSQKKTICDRCGKEMESNMMVDKSLIVTLGSEDFRPYAIAIGVVILVLISWMIIIT